MSAKIEYMTDTASVAQIEEHLLRCDADFMPPLSERVKIYEYARKIVSKAIRFEAWSDGTLVGLVAAYCNDQISRIAYLTSVSVLKEWSNKGIVASLMGQCVEHTKITGMQQITLEVASENAPAIKLYGKNGFVVGKMEPSFITMHLYLGNEVKHEQKA